MARKIRVENLEHLGLTATVIDGGQQYSSYTKFAEVAGYPNAASEGFFNNDTVNAYDLEGKMVRVLAKGNHGTQYDTVYVCETLQGDQFLIGEDGLKGIGHLKEPETSSLASVNNDELLAELKRRLEEGTIQQESISPPKSDSPQYSRDVVVKQAKLAIEGLKGIDGYYRIPFDVEIHSVHVTKVEFIVNREKRVVVALMRGINTNKIRGKGIAKCDPTDCFNEHIGKAIALYRALGKEVPEYLLNAPKPTGFQVGDIITFPEYDAWHGKVNYRVDRLDKVNSNLTCVKCHIDDAGFKASANLSNPSNFLVVLDDSARY